LSAAQRNIYPFYYQNVLVKEINHPSMRSGKRFSSSPTLAVTRLLRGDFSSDPQTRFQKSGSTHAPDEISNRKAGLGLPSAQEKAAKVSLRAGLGWQEFSSLPRAKVCAGAEEEPLKVLTQSWNGW
jgi:hypothetical protein